MFGNLVEVHNAVFGFCRFAECISATLGSIGDDRSRWVAVGILFCVETILMQG